MQDENFLSRCVDGTQLGNALKNKRKDLIFSDEVFSHGGEGGI